MRLPWFGDWTSISPSIVGNDVGGERVCPEGALSMPFPPPPIEMSSAPSINVGPDGGRKIVGGTRPELELSSTGDDEVDGSKDGSADGVVEGIGNSAADVGGKVSSILPSLPPPTLPLLVPSSPGQ
jgi:hypothetical protein